MQHLSFLSKYLKSNPSSECFGLKQLNDWGEPFGVEQTIFIPFFQWSTENKVTIPFIFLIQMWKMNIFW